MPEKPSFIPGSRLPTIRYRWFLELVFKEKSSIRQSCKKMKISYSNGKNIIRDVKSYWDIGLKHPKGGWKGEYIDVKHLGRL